MPNRHARPLALRLARGACLVPAVLPGRTLAHVILSSAGDEELGAARSVSSCKPFTEPASAATPHGGQTALLQRRVSRRAPIAAAFPPTGQSAPAEDAPQEEAASRPTLSSGVSLEEALGNDRRAVAAGALRPDVAAWFLDSFDEQILETPFENVSVRERHWSEFEEWDWRYAWYISLCLVPLFTLIAGILVLDISVVFPRTRREKRWWCPAGRSLCSCLRAPIPPAAEAPDFIIREVAEWLPARELCLLGGTSRSHREIPGELLSDSLLIDEVRRLGIEQEWTAERESLHQQAELLQAAAGRQGAITCKSTPASILCWFLRQRRKQMDEEYSQKANAQFKHIQEDLVRFVIMCICVLYLLCQVIRLAIIGNPRTSAEYVTALLSPLLVCYVLEKWKEPLCWRSVATGLVALVLFLNSVHRHL